ncbi:MAG: hypothetical protein NVS1B1_10010 [Candidatus Limnocylindrales bacterium]
MLFVDDGGVLNDNERRAPEWRRLIGDFFAPRLGGTREAWAAANAAVFPGTWERYLAHIRTATTGVREFLQAEDRRWLVEMCAAVGVEVAADEVDDLVEASHRYITRNADCAYPESAQAIRDVARSGITLHTASGETSVQLDGYLRAMGLRELFDRPYGTDLIDRFKSGPHYYAAILADSGVDPADAVVVDDSAEALDWAAACGLRTIQVARGGGGGGRHETITSLSSLPLLL